jgi:hypothetical protein
MVSGPHFPAWRELTDDPSGDQGGCFFGSRYGLLGGCTIETDYVHSDVPPPTATTIEQASESGSGLETGDEVVVG